MRSVIVLLALFTGCLTSPTVPTVQNNTATFPISYSGISAWYDGDSILWNFQIPSHVSFTLTKKDSLISGVEFDSTKWRTYTLDGYKKDDGTYACFFGGTTIDTNIASFSGTALTITDINFSTKHLTHKFILHE